METADKESKEDKERREKICSRAKELAGRAKTNKTYTDAEAMVDLVEWTLRNFKDTYFGKHWYNDNDETMFVRDMVFILGGVDYDQSFSDWVDGKTDTRWLVPMGDSGFKEELNDHSNTMRHFWANFGFSYGYGDTMGNFGAWWRDLRNKKDRLLGYVAADLGEELDDVNDPFGYDLDDIFIGIEVRACDVSKMIVPPDKREKIK